MPRIIKDSHKISWLLYKSVTKQEIMPGDEYFDSVITNYNEELVYTAPSKPKEKVILIMKK
ncbi:MAG: hypothetical protein ACTSQA_03420 [Candidatus Heimdallarchaeaceae archaeon]